MKPGTVVTLKSGGPKMTSGSKTAEGKWFCQWFFSYADGSFVYSEDYFHEDSLAVVSEN